MGGRGAYALRRAGVATLSRSTRRTTRAAGGGGGGSDTETQAPTQRAITARDTANPARFTGKFTAEFDSPAANANAVALFNGKNVTAKQVARLVGAPDGAHVTIESAYGGALRTSISHPYITRQTRTISNEGGQLVISNDYFRASNNAPKGFGSKVFARQVQAARQAKASRIDTYAAGNASDTGFNGYYTWARFGYNAPLYKSEIAALPSNLRGATNLNQLMAKGGASWWKTHGEGRDMSFDLRKNSVSLRVLSAYLRGSRARRRSS